MQKTDQDLVNQGRETFSKRLLNGPILSRSSVTVCKHLSPACSNLIDSLPRLHNPAVFICQGLNFVLLLEESFLVRG